MNIPHNYPTPHPIFTPLPSFPISPFLFPHHYSLYSYYLSFLSLCYFPLLLFPLFSPLPCSIPFPSHIRHIYPSAPFLIPLLPFPRPHNSPDTPSLYCSTISTIPSYIKPQALICQSIVISLSTRPFVHPAQNKLKLLYTLTT